jgi:hypothetical protein
VFSPPSGGGNGHADTVASMVCRVVVGHTAYTSRHTSHFYQQPGSAFASLTAAGLPTNLPLSGQLVRSADEFLWGNGGGVVEFCVYLQSCKTIYFKFLIPLIR